MIILLTGSNAYATREAARKVIEAVVQTHGKDVVDRVDVAGLKPSDLPQLLMGTSLFSSERLVIFDNLSQNKAVWSVLDEQLAEVPDETTVLLTESNPDKRTKAYKWLLKHADVHEFNELDERSAAEWIQKEAKTKGGEIPAESARYFVQYVGLDQWRLTGELDKLLLAEAPITRELIQDVTEPQPQATAFELLDAAFGGDQETLERILVIVSRSEDPYKFFGLLASQVFALVAVKAAGDRRADEVAKDFGLHPFVVRKVGGLASRLDQAAVNRVVEILARGDEQLKTTGAEPWSVISRMLYAMHTTR